MRAFVLDANSLITRCIMASAPTDLQANATFVGGIYGSLRVLSTLLLLPDIQIDRVAAFFDCGVPKRRLALLPGYKSDRKARKHLLTDEQKVLAFKQLDQCRELFELLGIRCLTFRDREADDGVAAACRVFVETLPQAPPPIVASTDADLLQTIGMGADVYDFGHGRWVTRENFAEITGVEPSYYVLYRTLVGDTSDSIRGANGCGPARAGVLLGELRASFDVEKELPPHIDDMTPLEQLDCLGALLRQRPMKVWEQAIVDDLPRLKNVARGIDLSASFGPTASLASRLADFPAFRPLDFLRACNRLRLRSVLGDPESYLRAFRQIEKRRVAGTSASTV